MRVEAKSGENGKLYGSITGADVAEALKEQWGLRADKRDIHIAEAVKSAGRYAVTVRLYAGKRAEMVLEAA